MSQPHNRISFCTRCTYYSFSAITKCPYDKAEMVMYKIVPMAEEDKPRPLLSAQRYGSVRFGGFAKEYAYKTDLTDLEPGDEVVVQARGGESAAIFVEYIPPTTVATKYILRKTGLKVNF